MKWPWIWVITALQTAEFIPGTHHSKWKRNSELFCWKMAKGLFKQIRLWSALSSRCASCSGEGPVSPCPPPSAAACVPSRPVPARVVFPAALDLSLHSESVHGTGKCSLWTSCSCFFCSTITQGLRLLRGDITAQLKMQSEPVFAYKKKNSYKYVLSNGIFPVSHTSLCPESAHVSPKRWR